MMVKQKKSGIACFCLVLMIFLLFSLSCFALPVPTMVIGNYDGVAQGDSLNDLDITISAYETGTNFSVLLYEGQAKIDYEKKVYGTALTTDIKPNFDVVIDALGSSTFRSYYGTFYLYNITPNNHQEYNISLSSTVIFVPKPPSPKPSADSSSDSSGGSGGGGGGIDYEPSEPDDKRSEMPPVDIPDNVSGDDVEKSYNESRDSFNKKYDEKKEKEEQLRLNYLIKITIQLIIIFILLSFIVIRTLMFFNPSLRDKIIGFFVYKKKNNGKKNISNQTEKITKEKKSHISSKMLIILILALMSLLFFAVFVYAVPLPQPVQGYVFGPGKYAASANVSFYEEITNNTLASEVDDVNPGTTYPFYLIVITLDEPPDYFVHVDVNSSYSLGHNETQSAVTNHGSGDDIVLNITMHSDLNITNPSDSIFYNITTFNISWEYPNDDWINFSVLIDDDSDYSSPLRGWAVNDTSYNMSVLESLPDDNYNLKVTSYDADADFTEYAVDYEEISFIVDTQNPYLTSMNTTNESWHNENITFSFITNEITECKYDFVKGINYDAKNHSFSLLTDNHELNTNFTSQGNYTYYIQCKDRAGNIMNLKDEYVFYLKFDNVHPTTTNNYTANNTWIKEDVIIELIANDTSPSSGINVTKYCIGAGCNPLTGTNYTTPLFFGQGSYILRYQTWDNVFNQEPVNELIINIDKTAPNTEDDFLDNATWIASDSTITITPRDDLLADNSGINWTKYCFGESCTPDTNYTTPLTITDENRTYLKYRSQDIAGNVQNIQTILIMLDKTGPDCNLASVEIENGSFFIDDTTLVFNYSGFYDNLSGIDEYHYSFSDEGNYVNPDADLFGELSGAVQGNNTIFVWSEDLVGNLGCSVNSSIIVDTIAPVFDTYYNEDINEDTSDNLYVNVSISDATTNISGKPTIRYRYGPGVWSNYYEMNVSSYGNYYFEIPEYVFGWNLFRNQDVFWEINVTDYLDNERVSALQSEHIDSINDPPILSFIENTSAQALFTMDFWIDANDPDNDGVEDQNLTFLSNITNISVIKYNDTRALVVWAPNNSWAYNNLDTNHTINFSVHDDGIPLPVLYDWQLVSIQVNFTNEPPNLEPIGNLFVSENESLYYDVNGSDPNGHNVTFYDNTSLFDIDSQTGEIFFSPDNDMVGNYSIKISVGDYEYNDSETIELRVINVENNVTFILRDRILDTIMNNITLNGGNICKDGCNFSNNITMIEPKGNYSYNFSKVGFSDINLSLDNLDEDAVFYLYLNDTQAPEMKQDLVYYDFFFSYFYDNYSINTSVDVEDNLQLKNASMNWTRYDHTQTNLLGSGYDEMSQLLGNLTRATYNISLGEYKESFILFSNISVFDLYGNELLIPIDKIQFIYVDGTIVNNYPPFLNHISTQYLMTNEPYEYKVLAHDLDDENIIFADNASFFEINESTGMINFTPANTTYGEHLINISVTDGNATTWQNVNFIIDKGNNVTFRVMDDVYNNLLDNAYLQGGRECEHGCEFNGTITVVEASDSSTYTLRVEGYNQTEITFSSYDGQVVDVFLHDTEPAQIDEINLTASLGPSNKTYYVNISALVSDNLEYTGVDFWYNITDSGNNNLIGQIGNITLTETSSNTFKGSFGPFSDPVYIDSAEYTYDISGNTGVFNNALRHFFFFRHNVSSLRIVIVKDIQFLNQEVYNITYRLTDTIYNTAGEDLENIQFRDTDINNSFMYFDIPKEGHVTVGRNITLDKTATGQIWQTVSAAASHGGMDFYSNSPKVSIPGFGGPFDLILYPDSSSYPSQADITFDAYLENMNPVFGQDAVLTYWTELLNGSMLDLTTETLFVPAMSHIRVPRSIEGVDLNNTQSIFLKANITWTFGQAAYATRTLSILQPTCSDGIQNQGETSPDCGGPCPACPTCDDGIKNRDESDIDCGGTYCDACIDGLRCVDDEDCESLRCIEGYCFPATCSDGIKNQGESDIDCGGPCPPCLPFSKCNYDTDCSTGICENSYCQPITASCYDGIKNQGESDIDCGGPCPRCKTSKACMDNDDCESLNCGFKKCLEATCYDGIKNQGEKDIDCGGPCISCILKDFKKEPDADSYINNLGNFSRTIIRVSGDSNMVIYDKRPTRNYLKKGDVITIQNIVRYLGYGAVEVEVEERLPPYLELLSQDYSEKYIDGNGDTVVKWDRKIHNRKFNYFNYTVKYKDNSIIYFEFEEPLLSVNENNLAYDNMINIFYKKKLPQLLRVRKTIIMDEEKGNAKVTLEFINEGDLDLKEINAKESLPKSSSYSGIDESFISSGMYLPSLKPQSSYSVTYDISSPESLDALYLMPQIKGISQDDIKYELVLDSDIEIRYSKIFDLTQKIFAYMIVLIFVMVYLLNFYYIRKSDAFLSSAKHAFISTITFKLEFVSFIKEKFIYLIKKIKNLKFSKKK